jgi:tRNA (guanine10-N2)-dimethyltransferase
MKLLFFLSGEHETLPGAEVLAVLESMGIKYKVLDSFEQALVVDTSQDIVLDGVSKRLGMSHAICELIGVCENDADEIRALAEEMGEIDGSFAVRIKRIKRYGKALSTLSLEREIGGIIDGKSSAKVDLENPDEAILGIISKRFAVGRVIADADRSQYEERRPHKRPYFHPGAILPRISRACVNLTRVRPGERFLDPFCGTGGFLIEAGLIGAEVHGFDIDAEAVHGCKKNLSHYGIDYSIAVKDAMELDSESSFDAVATDPPYGISASTKGLSLDELYSKALESIYFVLKEGRYACIVSPKDVPVEKLSEDVGFEVVEVHFERIHRSLTRKISVLKK